jgi:hypothetical protein
MYEYRYNYEDFIATKEAFSEFTLKRQYIFLLTITFSRKAKELESDRNIKHIFRMLNKLCFGKRYLKKNQFIRFFLVRGKKLSNLSHYHIFIEYGPELTFDRLVDSFILCTQKIECLDTLTVLDRKMLTTDHYTHVPNEPSLNIRLLKKLGVINPNNYKQIMSIRNRIQQKKTVRKINCNLVEIKNPIGAMNYIFDHFSDFDYFNYAVSGTTSEGYYDFNTRY